MGQLRVLVTGGGRGIGRAIALRFAKEGAKVCVASRTSAELDAVVTEIEAAGGEGLAAQMNVRDFGSVEAAVYRAVNFTTQVLDVLVNCAGSFDIVPFDKMQPDVWSRMIETNLTGAFSTTLEAIDALEDGNSPHIFNIASVAAREGFPGNTAYCASKYGLRGFSDALRHDLKDSGIRVTTVYPGQTATEIWDRVEGDWDKSQMLDPAVIADKVFEAYGTDVADLDVTG